MKKMISRLLKLRAQYKAGAQSPVRRRLRLVKRGMSYEAILKAKLDPEQTLRELAASLNVPPGAE